MKKNEMTNKIDWPKKLTSRKFWALVADLGVSIALIVYALINGADITPLITGAVLALGGVVAYIFGESLVDSQHVDDK